MLFNGYHIYAIFFILASVVSADFAADRIEFTNKMKKTMKMQTNELQGEISTYWNNYPQCSRQCKIDVYKSGISGCFLTNTCLCRNAFWLEATARCVKGRCGNEELLATAHETWRACEKWGGPISLSEDEYIGAGFGVERAPQDSATTATASNGGDGGADSSGNSSNSVVIELPVTALLVATLLQVAGWPPSTWQFLKRALLWVSRRNAVPARRD